jgi:hypothetical protein
VQEGHLVKITVRVAVDTGDDTTEPVETQVLALSRDELTPDTLGLRLAEAHELLAALQEALVNAQVTRALDQHRHCPECDTAFRRKDIKTIRLTTLFGVVAVDSPRYRSCPCRVREVATVSPLTTVLTEHTTPETVYMQARFAAVMSYRPAAALLGEVFPLGRTLHAAGVREQTHRVAARLDNERGPENTAGFSCCPRDLEDLPVPALPLVVGLDGGYVHSTAQTSRSNGWFEVIAGKSIPTDGEGDAKCFAFVQTIETKPRRRLHEVLTAQGVQANQAVVFLTDGGEDVRDLPRYLYPLSEHYLDWFHITMRLTVLANTAKSLAPLPEVPDFAARIGTDLERLKWLLWHGNTFRADQMLSWLEDDLYVDDETADPPIVQLKLAKYFHEFATYIRANAHLIPNYGERYRCGEAISSAIAESTVNQVVSKRMCKKQQMRWSPTGAQLFLQIRTAVLNNDLAGHFQRWYPAFTHPGGPAEIEVDLAA